MRERGLYESRPDVCSGIKGRVGAACEEPPARRQRGGSLERSRKGGGGASRCCAGRQLGRFLGVGEGGGPPGREPGTPREGPVTPVSVAEGWRIRHLPLPDQLPRTQDARCPASHCALHPENNRAIPARPSAAHGAGRGCVGRGGVCGCVLSGSRVFSPKRCSRESVPLGSG